MTPERVQDRLWTRLWEGDIDPDAVLLADHIFEGKEVKEYLAKMERQMELTPIGERFTIEDFVCSCGWDDNSKKKAAQQLAQGVSEVLDTAPDNVLRSEIAGVFGDVRTGPGTFEEAAKDRDETAVLRGGGSVSELSQGDGREDGPSGDGSAR